MSPNEPSVYPNSLAPTLLGKWAKLVFDHSRRRVGGGSGDGGEPMEEVEPGRKRRRERKRKTTANDLVKKPPPSPSPLLHLSFDRTAFPLLLAAVGGSEDEWRGAQSTHARTLLRRLLRSHLDLLRRGAVPCTSSLSSSISPSVLLPPSLLSIIPVLLTKSCPPVSVLSAEMVGAASLHSIEANKIVALDHGVVNGLVRALRSSCHRVVEAVCNAILDLSTTSIGKQRLLQNSAVKSLSYLLCQVVTVMPISFGQLNMEKETNGPSKRMAKDERFLILILDAITILINSSFPDCLASIPQNLAERLLDLLKKLWYKINNIAITSDSRINLLHHIRCNLATTIFRLSMDQANSLTSEIDIVREGIFGEESDFKEFLLNYWEVSPILLYMPSRSSNMFVTLFSSIISSFRSKSIDELIDSILEGSVSCPPISSDELDINCFLSEMNGSLGSPIIYRQDVRILKAQPLTSSPLSSVKNEVHFFENDTTTLYVDGTCLKKCKEAFQLGFTIALRGMEFRFSKISALTNGLADLFGLPSVGVNLYLTPANSQGLARHYDDHCVFVWQIFGQKQWSISPHPMPILPRLYEPNVTLAELDKSESQGLKIFLKEGDILYIPRGCSHEANTVIDDDGSWTVPSANFSLHLTLSLEVEPPFEWEGFAHVAVHSWQEKQKVSDGFCSSESRRLKVLSVLLLHILIRTLADQSSILRKACLVAAKFSSLKIIEKHQACCLSTFRHIIGIINSSSGFTQVVSRVRSVVQEENDEPLQWMRWLQHLPQAGDENEKLDFGNPLRVLVELVESDDHRMEHVRMAFTETKLNFCTFVSYKDACQSFISLMERYRSTRNQYMKGMLSLHSTYGV